MRCTILTSWGMGRLVFVKTMTESKREKQVFGGPLLRNEFVFLFVFAESEKLYKMLLLCVVGRKWGGVRVRNLLVK